MPPHLLQQSYGKSSVRLTKLKRDDEQHQLVEASVDVELDGDFGAAYTDGDNSLVLPTDTIKNTIYVFARQLDLDDLEPFAWTLGCHFIENFPHVSQAAIRVKQRPWRRVRTGDAPHPHAFLGTSSERDTCLTQIVRGRDGEPEGSIESGIEELALMKTTASGFSNFLRDDLTTLEDVDDRILATTLTVTWSHNQAPADWRESRDKVREALISAFAGEYSPSVQATLYAMGQAALDVNPYVEDLSLSMPNQHRVLVDLEQLGYDNPNVLFVPMDEPFGNISAVIGREPDERQDS